MVNRPRVSPSCKLRSCWPGWLAAWARAARPALAHTDSTLMASPQLESAMVIDQTAAAAAVTEPAAQKEPPPDDPTKARREADDLGIRQRPELGERPSRPPPGADRRGLRLVRSRGHNPFPSIPESPESLTRSTTDSGIVVAPPRVAPRSRSLQSRRTARSSRAARAPKGRGGEASLPPLSTPPPSPPSRPSTPASLNLIQPACPHPPAPPPPPPPPPATESHRPRGAGAWPGRGRQRVCASRAGPTR